MKRRFALSLRVKLALVALSLLTLPWAGIYYVNEMERLLLRGQEQTLLATARAVATALHDRPQLLAVRPDTDSALRRQAEAELRRLAEAEGRAPLAEETEEQLEGPEPLAPESPATQPPVTPPPGGISEKERREEVMAILRAVQRTSSRIWVVNRRYEVLALAGSLRRSGGKNGRDNGNDNGPHSGAAESGWRALWEKAAGWVIRRPTEDFAETAPDDALATEREVAAALQGALGTRSRRSRDGRAVIVSATHPIWSGSDILGAVVVEETTNPILSLRSTALERLLGLTLALFAGVALILIFYATRVSQRIRRLRDEAESAIDASGRIRSLNTASEAGDEIGDLSRSFSTMLEKLAQHHSYLEALSGRLSHELRTPIAVVRSSLENLKLAQMPEDARRYLARADEGLTRLNTILQRMSEATRLEQSLSTQARERYDLGAVVRGCVEGYRLAYPQTPFALEMPLEAPEHVLTVEGAPDLAAQLLDKLVENAVQFSPKGSTVTLRLAEREGNAELRVENFGPPLPATMQGRLFESMVSVRDGGAGEGGGPHLGLGLYVARLIAEFHGGTITAHNLPDGNGVAMVVRLPAVHLPLTPAPRPTG